MANSNPFETNDLSSNYPEETQIAFEQLMESHPKLKAIALRFHEEERPPFYHHGNGVGDAEDPPYVSMNVNWLLIANQGLDLPETKPVRDILQNNLGINECSPELMITFILLHEYGHGYHFYGLNAEERIAFLNKIDSDFVTKWGAKNKREYLQQNPGATPQELYAFTSAYRNRTQEQRADSLACEILQRIKKIHPYIFPEITNLVKNFL